MYYNECEYCGAALDPGERCECEKGMQKIKETKKENAPTYEALSFKQLSLLTSNP